MIDKILEDLYNVLKAKWWGVPIIVFGVAVLLVFTLWNSLPDSTKEQFLMPGKVETMSAEEDSKTKGVTLQDKYIQIRYGTVDKVTGNIVNEILAEAPPSPSKKKWQSIIGPLQSDAEIGAIEFLGYFEKFLGAEGAIVSRKHSSNLRFGCTIDYAEGHFDLVLKLIEQLRPVSMWCEDGDFDVGRQIQGAFAAIIYLGDQDLY